MELPYAEEGTRIAQFRATNRMMKVANDIAKRNRLGMGPDENPGRIEVTNEDGHVVAAIEFPPRGSHEDSN
jgi:hypothetical protein